MTTIFTGAKVFDGFRFLDRPHDITVDGDRIVSVAPTAPGSATTPGADVIDATGRTVLPGFIDMHVHLMLTEVSALEQVTKPYSLPYYEAVVNARTTLESGITSVRDAGGSDAGLRAAIEQGLIEGPRMKLAISMLSITGGHGDSMSLAGVEIAPLRYNAGRPHGVVDGPDEARRRVREVFRAGADHIKICATGGVLSPNDDPAHAHFTMDELTAIAEEASAHGSYVMAHALGAEGVKNALRAGIRTIEHGTFVDDEAIELFLEKDAVIVPTLSTLGAVFDMATRKHIPANMLEKARRAQDALFHNFAKMVEAGVTVAMGSDVGVGPHGTGLRELPLMAEYGLGLEGSLAAGTGVAGGILDAGNAGVIQPGAYADLVLTDLPLASADDLQKLPERIEAVWKGGREVTATAGDAPR